MEVPLNAKQYILDKFIVFQKNDDSICIINNVLYCDVTFTITQNGLNFYFMYTNVLMITNYSCKTTVQSANFIDGLFRINQ